MPLSSMISTGIAMDAPFTGLGEKFVHILLPYPMTEVYKCNSYGICQWLWYV